MSSYAEVYLRISQPLLKPVEATFEGLAALPNGDSDSLDQLRIKRGAAYVADATASAVKIPVVGLRTAYSVG